MVVPVLGTHNARDEQAYGCSNGCRRYFLNPFFHYIIYCHYAKTNPYSESVERTSVGVVTLTRLARILVQINHNGDTCKYEQRHHNPEILLITVEVEAKTEQTKQQRQEVIFIGSRIVGVFRRQVVLRAKPRLVNKLDAANPVAAHVVAVALNIVLAADKVPHKVAPVHKAALIADEEGQILAKSRLNHCLRLALVVFHLNLAPLDVSPVFVVGNMFLTAAVHAREEGAHLLIIIVFNLIRPFDIFPIFLNPCFSLVFIRVVDVKRCVVVLSVDERAATILLAVEIAQERVGVFGVVLVDRRSGVRADDNSSIRAVAYKQHRHRKQNGVQHHTSVFMCVVDTPAEQSAK